MQNTYFFYKKINVLLYRMWHAYILLVFSNCLATNRIFITIIILILPYLIFREINNANISRAMYTQLE